MTEPVTATLDEPTRQGLRERGPAAAATMRKYGAAVALLVLVIFSSLQSDRFLQVDNVLNVLRQISIVGVLALGMTFVIITAGIDLSVGSMLSVVVVYTANTVQTTGVLAGVLTALGLGAAFGLINGLGIAFGRIQPFVMTLGMLAFAKGIALIFTEGQPVAITNDAFLEFGVVESHATPAVFTQLADRFREDVILLLE